MNELVEEVPVNADDAAWAAVNTPLSVDELVVFCQDIERLYRINPLLEFKKWENTAANSYRMFVRNISQEEAFELDTGIEKQDNSEHEFTLKYTTGIKSKTVFKIESSEYGSKLTITDHYEGLSEEERESRLSEVDKSLVTWVNYIQRYLLMWKKWSKYGWWRWYMRRVWQPMKPSGRRITYMLLWITVVEIALIILGVGIYLVEYA